MSEAGTSEELACGARGLLKDALALREATRDGEIDPDAYLDALDALGARRDELLAAEPVDLVGRRLVKHLRREAEALFSFLILPGVEATNHEAERAIRPAVVNRKSWGGNLTWRGAAT